MYEGNAGAADQSQGQSLIAPRGVCFGSGYSGHKKKWCLYVEQGEAAARSEEQGATVPQGGTSVLEKPYGQGEDNTMDRIWSRTRSRTGERSEAVAGTSSGARNGRNSHERRTTGQCSLLAAGEEDGGSSTHG